MTRKIYHFLALFLIFTNLKLILFRKPSILQHFEQYIRRHLITLTEFHKTSFFLHNVHDLLYLDLVFLKHHEIENLRRVVKLLILVCIWQ